MTAPNFVTFSGVSGTDVTANVQAALTLAGENDLEFVVPDGTWVISATVSTNQSVRVRGQSPKAILQRSAAASFTGRLVNLAGPNSYLSNLTIDGNGANVSGINIGDVWIAGAGSIVDAVQVINTYYQGIYVGAANCTIKFCTISGLATAPSSAVGQGIYAANNYAGTLILGNTITGTGLEGIAASGVGVRIIDNDVSGCHTYTGSAGGQIKLYDSNGTYTVGAMVADNYVGAGGSTNSYGVEINGKNGVVEGNSIIGQQASGIVLDSGYSGSYNAGWTIDGNVVTNSGSGNSGTSTLSLGAGIYISANVNDVIVAKNRLVDNQSTHTMTTGVAIAAGAGDTYSIEGNTISGYTQAAGISDSSTGVNKVIAGNIGVDDVIPSIASAAALALPINPTIILTGTTGITSITGLAWNGRKVLVIPQAAVSFTATNNIANAFTAVPNVPFWIVFNGANWNILSSTVQQSTTYQNGGMLNFDPLSGQTAVLGANTSYALTTINVVAGETYWHPFSVTEPITVNNLGAMITAGAAGATFSVGIYGNLASNGDQPTASPLCEAAGLSAAATGAIIGSVGTPYEIQPTTKYWAAFQSSGTPTVRAHNANGAQSLGVQAATTGLFVVSLIQTGNTGSTLPAPISGTLTGSTTGAPAILQS